MCEILFLYSIKQAFIEKETLLRISIWIYTMIGLNGARRNSMKLK